MQSPSSAVVTAFACLLLAGCAGTTGDFPVERNNAVSQHTSDTNKRAVRRLFEAGFNRAELAVIDQVVAPEYQDAQGGSGPAAFKDTLSRLRGAFPDIHYTVEDLLAEGDAVAVRWRWTGTHRGNFRGIAATDRSVTNNGAALFRLRDGKIVSAALDTDRLGFLQAIGVLPPNDALFGPSSPSSTARSR